MATGHLGSRFGVVIFEGESRTGLPRHLSNLTHMATSIDTRRPSINVWNGPEIILPIGSDTSDTPLDLPSEFELDVNVVEGT